MFQNCQLKNNVSSQKTYFSNESITIAQWIKGIDSAFSYGSQKDKSCFILARVLQMCEKYAIRTYSGDVTRKRKIADWISRDIWVPSILEVTLHTMQDSSV